MPHPNVRTRFSFDPRAGLLVGCTLAASAAQAATAFPPVKRTPVLEARLAEATRVGTVTGTRIAFAAGQPTPLHRHPVPVVGVVTAGSVVFQPDGQPSRVLRTGDAFYEPANVRILRFDNASSSEPAEITAFYLAERPDQPLIELIGPAKP